MLKQPIKPPIRANPVLLGVCLEVLRYQRVRYLLFFCGGTNTSKNKHCAAFVSTGFELVHVYPVETTFFLAFFVF